MDIVRRRTAIIPEGKNNVVLVGVDWKLGYIPTGVRFGVARRTGDHFLLSTEAETRFSKATTNAGVYAAWIWSLLFVLLLPAAAAAQQHTYTATVVRVIDGDTYQMRLDLGFDIAFTCNIRLLGLDTPERFTPEGKQAAAAADHLLRTAKVVTVRPTGAMTFARYVAEVLVDGRKLADLLEAAGHRKK